MIIRLLFLFLLVSQFAIVAQDLNMDDTLSIEKSTDYYWGKGRSTQATKAEELAGADLSEKIVTFLYSSKKVQTITSVSEGEVKETDIISTFTKRFSTLHLAGLEKKIIENEGGFTYWVYISKKKYDKSLEDLAEKVENITTEASEQMRLNNINGALSLFYKAYLLSYSSPKELYSLKNTGSEKRSLNLVIETGLEKILSGILIVPQKPVPVAGEGMLISVPLTVEYAGIPVSNLKVFSEIQTMGVDVIGGKATIEVELPKVPKEEEQLKIRPTIISGDHLEELDSRFMKTVRKRVDIDYSGLMKFNIKHKITGNVLIAEMEQEFINVLEIFWEASTGDSNRKNQAIFKTDLGDQEKIVLKLRVNNCNDLTLEKIIDNPNFKGKKEIRIMTDDFEKDKEIKETTAKADSVKNLQKDNVKGSLFSVEAILKELTANMSVTEIFLSALDKLRKEGVLYYGKKNIFANPDNCYVAIRDAQSNKIIAILSPVTEGKRINLINGEKIENLAEKYKGKNPIWFDIR